MWTIILSTLALANPEDIESLGNKTDSSKSPQQDKEKQEKNQERKKQEDEDKQRLEEELEQEEIEEENLEQQLWEQEELERQEENTVFNNYDVDNQDDFQNFGTPDDLEYQEELDVNLFESNSIEDIDSVNSSQQGSLGQQVWNWR